MQIDELRLRVDDVDDGAVTGAARDDIASMYRLLEEEVARQRDLPRYEYVAPAPAEFPGRQQLHAWAAAHDDAFHAARTAAGEQLNW